ncbi:MAG: iron ABC transporter permease [Cyclobacteriaceae bacterium]|nr:iron ABC transporter permease [Cyclobacteriaceae bacterium]
MDNFSSRKAVILVLLTVLLLVLNLSLGSVLIPPGEIIKILAGQKSEQEAWNTIIWDFRMTKALTCILAGGALSISGLQMQTLFRNALAGPDVLGLSSGASLAVSLLIMAGTFLTPGPWAIAIAASLGCAGVFMIILSISFRLKDNVSLLIIGLMIGAGASSIVSVLQYLSKAEDLQSYIIWTFGSLGSLNWIEIKILAFVLVLGSAIALASVKTLNAWLLGDNYAQSVGIKLKKSRLLIIISACLLTGGVTAFCGPIAFVGLAVPHLTKMIFKTSNHKILIPMVMISGAALLLFCDIVSQLPGSAQVLPINAITAMIGAPVVIWVILRNKKITV